MIYICKYPFSLVSYYVKINHPNDEINYYGLTKKDLTLKGVKQIISSGDPTEEKVNLIQWKGKKPLAIVNCTPFNTTYICVEVIDSQLRDKLKRHAWLKELTIRPSEYSQGLNRIKPLCTEEAHRFLWNLWGYKPYKAQVESIGLHLLVAKNKKIITLEFILENYSTLESSKESIFQVVKYLGTKKGAEMLLTYPKKNLWILFFGTDNKPPLINYCFGKNEYLKTQFIHYSLAIIKESIDLKKISVKSAILIWHSWLINIDFPSKNYPNCKSLTNHQDIHKLRKLII